MKTKSILLKLFSLIICIILLTVSAVGCSKAPEYAQIEERFKSLIEAAYEINEIFFGKGLPVYERIYDPWDNMVLHKDVNEDGDSRYVYYCYMTDDTLGDVLAYRLQIRPVTYLQVLTEEDSSREAVYVRTEEIIREEATELRHYYYYETDYVPTYDEENDPWQKTSNHAVKDENGNTLGYVYYCYMEDRSILAYHSGFTRPTTYLRVLTEEDTAREAVYTRTDGEVTYYYYESDYTPPLFRDSQFWEEMRTYDVKDASGEVLRTVEYCYMTDEEEGDILAYRAPATSYLQVLNAEDPAREAVYSDGNGSYYYEVSYTPPECDFYYSEEDPTDYDYVHNESPYTSIQELKVLAEQVYSADYLSSVYSSMFEGVYSADDQYVSGLSPRYYEYTDENGVVYFMMSNTYESFDVSKNIFDYSTAKIVRPKNAKRVTVEIQFYPEGQPEARDTMRITLVLENGLWMLDSTTY